MQFRLCLLLLSLTIAPAIAAEQSFDMSTAIKAAGKLVDPGTTKAYIFFIPNGSPIDSTSRLLATNLSGLAEKKATVKVIGPDFRLNFEILKAALLSAHPGSLDGAIVIFVGKEQDFAELEKIAAASGAAFRATTCCSK